MVITGKWIGQYTYGVGYPDNCVGKSVPFELDLKSNGIEFDGFFSDDETKDIFKEMGTVNGLLENSFIEFSKRYPCLWEVNEEGEMEIFEDTPSHEINYTGSLVNDHFEGTWEIPSFFVDEKGPYTAICGSGTWTMKKL